MTTSWGLRGRLSRRTLGPGLADSVVPNEEVPPVYGLPAGLKRRTAKWLRQRDVNNCTLCNIAFVTAFQRHSCRQCGQVVCDDCSKHRLRLPGQPQRSKKRVCDSCAKQVSDQRATDLEEDLDVEQEILNQLRGSFVALDTQCEVFKRVLLEFDAISTGESGRLRQFDQDADCEEFAFDQLKDRASYCWAELRRELGERIKNQRGLVEAHAKAKQKLTDAVELKRDLTARHESVDTLRGQLAEIEAERDSSKLKHSVLQKELEKARRHVMNLEMERRKAQLARDVPENEEPLTISFGHGESEANDSSARDKPRVCRRCCTRK
eukprot:TRINITY_DN15828_c0_g1_i1.p1 TRINITY_DN15828_c0_g1~~TRINITY_DN15828_c0_g1_i1.p1  ORF type:complete len:322 (-),score=50.35 TRINITY_DN15828_c0_g1_i1:39-1004(-)